MCHGIEATSHVSFSRDRPESGRRVSLTFGTLYVWSKSARHFHPRSIKLTSISKTDAAKIIGKRKGGIKRQNVHHREFSMLRRMAKAGMSEG
jgi:hypothetical protein